MWTYQSFRGIIFGSENLFSPQLFLLKLRHVRSSCMITILRELPVTFTLFSCRLLFLAQRNQQKMGNLYFLLQVESDFKFVLPPQVQIYGWCRDYWNFKSFWSLIRLLHTSSAILLLSARILSYTFFFLSLLHNIVNHLLETEA